MLMAIDKKRPATDSNRAEVERIVDEILGNRNFVCSPECRLGIVDTVCSVGFCEKVPPRFGIGTVEYDAYESGLELGFYILSEMGLLPGRSLGKRSRL
jgi:hypothetical protein